MKFVYRPSIDNHDNLTWNLIDKDNGNLTVACDVEKEYQSLLLAAPDLLAAAKGTLQVLERMCSCEPGRPADGAGGGYCATWQHKQELRAAIAKVEGREA